MSLFFSLSLSLFFSYHREENNDDEEKEKFLSLSFAHTPHRHVMTERVISKYNFTLSRCMTLWRDSDQTTKERKENVDAMTPTHI